ncbi:MAG: CDP-alcohol phosphatidyltransferase family protein [Thermoplasmata archaeon]|nr:CDP-alcohol phosphatidyltransferase family protein [Thermoplasmata archaeon]MVT14728.1 CDP-alcohol phosphatidyltransferase family protein [Euryarchaeota archaeon]MVT35968.1 CDP-alcohol phosphatidyltransferase family protein [Euryarchaeota archaeon]
MVLDRYRKDVDSILEKISRPFYNLEPNTISIFSLILAAISGLFLYLGNIFLIFASISIIISSMLDAIDGKVARVLGKASKKGDFIDHMIDRYSDTFIVLGFTFSSYVHWYTGLFAFTGIFFTSYAGTQAQAVLGKRDYGGILGRADRLVIFIILPLLQFFIPIKFYGFSISDIFLILIGILGNITALQRLFRALRNL